MKQIFFLIAIIGLALLSCRKTGSLDPIPTSLDGKWRMIIVKENASGSTTTKPSSIQGDVDIIFTSTSTTKVVSLLQVGSKGAEVVALQKVLIKLGLLNTDPTGYFGNQTKLALMAYQKQNGIHASGKVDFATRVQLDK